MSSEQTVLEKLQKIFPVPIRVRWHENRSSYLSSRKEPLCLHLSLHRLFLQAPSPVLEALCRYTLKGDRSAKTILRQMAHLYFSQTTSEPDELSPKGRVYDLLSIYEEIKAQYFPTLPPLSIGWSDTLRLGKFRFITFGSFDRHRNQIRLHPLLDDVAVPRYFVAFIVYHEMLHAVVPSRIDACGSVRSHTPEFRRLEKQFADFAIAKAWEKNSLKFLKKRVSHGRP